jgi:hypothetical protein
MSALLFSMILVGSEVLTAVVMKSSIFWYITPCSETTRRYIPEYRIILENLFEIFFSQMNILPDTSRNKCKSSCKIFVKHLRSE